MEESGLGAGDSGRGGARPEGRAYDRLGFKAPDLEVRPTKEAELEAFAQSAVSRQPSAISRQPLALSLLASVQEKGRCVCAQRPFDEYSRQ